MDSIYEQNSEGDGHGVGSPLQHHYTIKGQTTYTFINVCINLYHN